MSPSQAPSSPPTPPAPVRADYGRFERVLPDDYRWVPSPQPGVERMMLDRAGGETGRATSIVRYAPDSHFPPHRHPLGEEVLVLQGTFSEGEARHGAGCYVRNPPGSSHAPSTVEGATIFVKLAQMQPGDGRVCIDTRDPERWVRREGREVCELFDGPAERVVLERLAAGQALAPLDDAGGAEVLVVSGAVIADGRTCPAGSWLRVPPGQGLGVVATQAGATVYLKTGHLAGMVS